MGSGSFLALVAPRNSLLRRMISSARKDANYREGSSGAAVHNLLHLHIHDAHRHHQHNIIDQKQIVVRDSQDDIRECLHERQIITDHGQPALLLLSFQVDLAERLQHLQLQGSGSAHLNWLLDALASALSTHASLRSALSTCSTEAIPADLAVKQQYARLAHQRADEVVGLLDVCSALKQVADDVQHQLHTLQQALQSVGQALAAAQQPAGHDHQSIPFSGAGRIRATARRLSACLSDVRPESLLRVTSEQYWPVREARASLLLAAKTVLTNASSDPAVTRDLSQAMDGTMLTSLLLLASAVSSVAAPSHRKSSAPAAPMAGPCKAITKYLAGKRGAQLAPWAAPLRQLERDLRNEEMGGALFQELTRLHASAANIHAAITNPDIQLIDLAVMRHRLDCLSKGSREAQACITTLRMHLGSLFQALIALRLALLES